METSRWTGAVSVPSVPFIFLYSFRLLLTVVLDGSILSWSLLQMEVAMYIIAQAIPLIRVLIVGEAGSQQQNEGSAPVVASVSENIKRPSAAAALDVTGHEDLELVQLPSGRVVRADSEEGSAFRQQQQQAASLVNTHENVAENAVVHDKVHQAWSDSGFSRRAWSKSPTASPEPAAHQRNLSEVSETVVSA